MTSALALSFLSFSIRAFISGSGCAGRLLTAGVVALSTRRWTASVYVLGGSEIVFWISSNLASILLNRFSSSFSIIILCVIVVAFFMEALAFSKDMLVLWLTLLKSSAAVSRSFNSSVKRVLFSSVICSVLRGGVSGIGVSRPSCGSVVFLGSVGSIAGVAFGGG